MLHSKMKQFSIHYFNVHNPLQQLLVFTVTTIKLMYCDWNWVLDTHLSSICMLITVVCTNPLEGYTAVLPAFTQASLQGTWCYHFPNQEHLLLIKYTMHAY